MNEIALLQEDLAPPRIRTSRSPFDVPAEALAKAALPFNDSPPPGGDVFKMALQAGINFTWCLHFFEKHGKEQFGPGFRIYPEDHDLIYTLLIYFLRHEKEAARLNLDLTKGILLTGPVGCGKTKLMTLMKLVPAPEKNYIMKPCRAVSFEFIQEGYEVINRYSKMSYAGIHPHPRAYCFDDLGTEHALKYYGNECNVMGEILLSRYDLFISNGMISHITTNLSASEIEDVYGIRVRSRMREVFNLIAFNKNSGDKRR